MSFDIVRRVRDLRDLKSPAKTVLLCLALRANESRQCWPSLRTIASDAGYDVSTVKRSLASLAESGLVHRETRLDAEHGDPTSTLYTVRVGAERADPGADSAYRPDGLAHTALTGLAPTAPGRLAQSAPRRSISETPSSKTQEDPPGAEGPTSATSRYRAAYAAGVSTAKASPYAFPSHQQATWDLNRAVATFAVNDGKPLRGDAVTDWITAKAAAFVGHVKASGDDPKFWSGFDPKGFLRWLNQGPTQIALQRAGGRNKQPLGDTSGWSRPIVGKPGDGDASTFDPYADDPG